MEVLTDTTQLAAALSPIRMRVLEQMHEPASATSLAPRLGLSRQTLNYHLRELEREGFLELVEERARRGCVERMLKVSSRAFVVDPALLGALADDPSQTRDRFSSTLPAGDDDQCHPRRGGAGRAGPGRRADRSRR